MDGRPAWRSKAICVSRRGGVWMQRKAEMLSSKSGSRNSIERIHKDKKMRLVTYSTNHEMRLGALLDRQVVDIQRALQTYCRAHGIADACGDRLASMMDLLAAGDQALQATAEAIQFVRTAASNGKENLGDILLDLSQVRLLAPLPHPGKILCIGGNFPAAGKLSAPEYPIIFLKPPSGITGPGMPIRVP